MHYVPNQHGQVITITQPVVANQPGLEINASLLHNSFSNLTNRIRKLEKQTIIHILYFIKVVAVPMQQGFTAPVLTASGEPPRYTTLQGAQMVAPQAQPAHSRAIPQPTNADNWINDNKMKI